MKKVRLSAGLEACISTGSFTNMRPSYVWEETIEGELGDKEAEERLRQLYKKCFGMLKEAEQKAVVERIQRERQDLRFKTSPSGNLLPSVTSIINYDADFFTHSEELVQYASQGNIIDAKVKHFIKTGKWVRAKELQDCWVDIVICSKGSLALGTDVGDFPGFLKKHPIGAMKVGERFYFDEEGYCGEPDFFGEPDFKDAKKVLTLFDVKRTANKIKNGLQLAAYCRKYGIEQGIIVPLSDKTNQGFSKPVIYNEENLNGYFKVFKKKQEAFKKRYGV